MGEILLLDPVNNGLLNQHLHLNQAATSERVFLPVVWRHALKKLLRMLKYYLTVMRSFRVSFEDARSQSLLIVWIAQQLSRSRFQDPFVSCSRLLHVRNGNCKYHLGEETFKLAQSYMDKLAKHGQQANKAALYGELCALLFAKSHYDEVSVFRRIQPKMSPHGK